jgi:hypothetical protein
MQGTGANLQQRISAADASVTWLISEPPSRWLVSAANSSDKHYSIQHKICVEEA